MSETGHVDLDCTVPIWDRFFLVHQLVVVGTVEPDSSPDFAPKHMAGPIAWDNLFGFACAPHHATYRNLVRTEAFTVSYPRPDQIVLVSMAAAPREADDSKPALAVLPSIPAKLVEGPLLADTTLHLECRLERVVDDLAANSLVIGRVVAAHVAPAALRQFDREDEAVLAEAPLLAYLQPTRYAAIAAGASFPFHDGWSR